MVRQNEPDDDQDDNNNDDDLTRPGDAAEAVSRAKALLKEIGIDGIKASVRKIAAMTDENPTGGTEGLEVVSVGDDEYVIEFETLPESFDDSAFLLFATSEDEAVPDELVAEFVTFEEAFSHACKHVVKDRLWAATH